MEWIAKRCVSVWLIGLSVLCCCLLATSSVALGGDNLVRNGSLDSDDLSEFNFRPTRDAQNKSIEDSISSLFVEDLTWNRCYRIDLLRYVTDKEGQKMIHAAVGIGGSRGYDFHDGRNAIAAEPDTTYSFTVQLRGTVQSANFKPVFYRGNALGYDNLDHTGNTSLRKAVPVTDTWQEYKGTFTTHADTTRVILRVSVYTHEKYGISEEPNTFLLIDNVRIEKASQTNPAAAAGATGQSATSMPSSLKLPAMYAAPRVDTSPSLKNGMGDAPWKDAPVIGGFRQLRADEPAAGPASTSFQVLAGPSALHVALSCLEPEPQKLRGDATTDGGAIWNDDSVEVFLIDTSSRQPILRQFAVNCRGARFMAAGAAAAQPGGAEYQAWRAAVETGEDRWTAVLEIPYTLLGFPERPEEGKRLQFNVCRTRSVGQVERTSWSYSGGDFRNSSRYGQLILGDPRVVMKDRIKQVHESLQDFIAGLGAADASATQKAAALQETLVTLENRLMQPLGEDAWRPTFTEIEEIGQSVRFLRLNQRKFHVFRVATTDNFVVPYRPEVPEKTIEGANSIDCVAAGNEFAALPIAIFNSSDRTEAYRVVLYGELDNGIEVPGLKTDAGEAFPAQQIVLREAIRVKTSDEAGAVQCLDPLAKMNSAQTITIPPGEAGLIWCTFDCRGVRPGSYRGTLRIIPQGLPAKFVLDKGWQYQGPMQEIPIGLTVRPFELAETAQIPLWLMNPAAGEEFYRDMVDHGNTHFQISPWDFRAEFDDQGRLIGSVDAGAVHAMLENYARWAGTYKMPPARFVVGFNAYPVFNTQWAKAKFAVGSEEWKRAFGAWLQAVEAVFREHGVSSDRYLIEMWDEPRRPNHKEVLATLELARQVTPEMRLLVTLGASMQTPDEIRQMARYTDAFCMWGSYFNSRAYQQCAAELRKAGKQLWYYYCDTRVLGDLYQYHRLHAWKALAHDMDGIGLFHYMAGPGGHYGRASWQTTVDGALAYNTSGSPTPSIRYEVFRQGLDDVRYLARLRKAVAVAQDHQRSSQLVAEAEKFLNSVVRKVAIDSSHRTREADAAREIAANLIQQLEKN